MNSTTTRTTTLAKCNQTYEELRRINETLGQYRDSWSASWKAIVGICVGLILFNLYFLFVAVRGLKRAKLPNRRYLLLINLSVADFVMAGGLAWVGMEVMDLDDALYSWSVVVFGMLLQFGCWICVTTYMALCLFQFFAIRYPLIYKTRITVRHCYIIIAGGWTIGISFCIYCILNLLHLHAGIVILADELTSWVYVVFYWIIVITFILGVAALKSCCWTTEASPKRWRSVFKLGLHILIFLVCFTPIIFQRLHYAFEYYPSLRAEFADPDCFSEKDFIMEFVNILHNFIYMCIPLFCRSILDIVVHLFYEPELRPFGRGRAPVSHQNSVIKPHE